MAANVGGLVVPPGSAPWDAVARYLTHLGGGGSVVAAVFPLQGVPTPVVANPAQWTQSQPWCVDVRRPAPSFASSVATRLRELKLERSRVGIVGTRGWARHGFVRELRERLPKVDWVDLTAPIDLIRASKSQEEIAFLDMSAQIVDAALLDAASALRPGTADSAAWGAAMEALARRGSELPVHERWLGGPPEAPLAALPSQRSVRPGWLVQAELEAAWGGYRAVADRPFSCGRPDGDLTDLAAVAADCWNDGIEAMRPGSTPADLATRILQADRHLPRAGLLAGAAISPAIRGVGLGGDPPYLDRQELQQADAGQALAPGWCGFYQVAVRRGVQRVSVGATVVVTRVGARSLTSAPQGIVVV